MECCFANSTAVGVIDNKTSQLIIDFKSVDDDGAIIQIVVWQVPRPVAPCLHTVKYRLVYIANNERVIGFDNERGKGDHCHSCGREIPYEFVSIDQLVEDFLAHVERYKNERHYGP
ncbi:DUF6516 family protein [Bordetella muralis]|uniref:toxin-antitoxin system TumE family protein n=1 Tax=Bordetella muralis TaxID=1649130 RepID=UPI0039EEC2B5